MKELHWGLWIKLDIVGVQEEYGKACTYFERAAEAEDFQAMFQLGVIYYDGLAGTPDYVSALMRQN